METTQMKIQPAGSTVLCSPHGAPTSSQTVLVPSFTMRVLGFEYKQETTKTLAGKFNGLTKFRTALLYKIKACNDFLNCN